jgi:hypothetical protein
VILPGGANGAPQNSSMIDQQGARARGQIDREEIDAFRDSWFVGISYEHCQLFVGICFAHLTLYGVFVGVRFAHPNSHGQIAAHPV